MTTAASQRLWLRRADQFGSLSTSITGNDLLSGRCTAVAMGRGHPAQQCFVLPFRDANFQKYLWCGSSPWHVLCWPLRFGGEVFPRNSNYSPRNQRLQFCRQVQMLVARASTAYLTAVKHGIEVPSSGWPSVASAAFVDPGGSHCEGRRHASAPPTPHHLALPSISSQVCVGPQ